MRRGWRGRRGREGGKEGMSRRARSVAPAPPRSQSRQRSRRGRTHLIPLSPQSHLDSLSQSSFSSPVVPSPPRARSFPSSCSAPCPTTPTPCVVREELSPSSSPARTPHGRTRPKAFLPRCLVVVVTVRELSYIHFWFSYIYVPLLYFLSFIFFKPLFSFILFFSFCF